MILDSYAQPQLAQMPPAKYILAFDQGTTSSRSVIVDAKGMIVAQVQEEFEQIYPQPGWVEHEPHALFQTQLKTACAVLAQAELNASDLAAIGLTNQRETTVVWDRQSGEPVYNAIVWQDRRTADYCAELKRAGYEGLVSGKTGLRLDPYFSASKLHWILENVAGVRARAEAGDLCFGTVDSWLLWQFTGGREHATDVTNASRTLLFNLEQGDWDTTLLELFDVPRCMLPEVKSCSEVYGRVHAVPELAGVTIAGIAGDQHAALFGQACFNAGMAKCSYGTGCFLLMHSGQSRVHSQHNLLSTVAWRIDGVTEYALEGSIFMAGATVQWLRDELQLVESAAELDQLASTVPDAAGLILVPAFTGLGAPHWDPYARGAALGMTRGTNRAHFCRAALEAIAFQCADLIQAMELDSGLVLQQLRVDGGAARSDTLLQFQADLLQTSVLRPQCIESTVLGAAYFAGLAVGFWDSRATLSRNWALNQSFNPQQSAAAMAAAQQVWNKAVDRSKNWEVPKL